MDHIIAKPEDTPHIWKYQQTKNDADTFSSSKKLQNILDTSRKVKFQVEQYSGSKEAYSPEKFILK